MKLGAHVSIAGGIWTSPQNAADLGCEVFQIFTRSPRGGPAPKLTSEVVKKFQDEKEKYRLGECIVHTPYYINFGSNSSRIFWASVTVVREELERASLLGASFVVSHLGSYKDL